MWLHCSMPGGSTCRFPQTDGEASCWMVASPEIPVDGAIGIRAAGLGSLPSDPIDRLIVATALERGAALLTADERLLSWKHPLERHDARR
jgi:PIN domain nuclease of toxin-antitoxin system